MGIYDLSEICMAIMFIFLSIFFPTVGSSLSFHKIFQGLHQASQLSSPLPPQTSSPKKRFKNLYFKSTKVILLFISFPNGYTPTITQIKEKNDTLRKIFQCFLSANNS